MHRKLKIWLLTGVVLTLGVLICTCLFFRISRPRDLLAYREMRVLCHPVWREFAWRRTHAGESAEGFLRRFPPSRHSEFGRYGVYEYFLDYQAGNNGLWLTGLTVVARDGKLIRSQAWSCTWQLTFFDDEDPDYKTEHAAFVRELVRMRQEQKR